MCQVCENVFTELVPDAGLVHGKEMSVYTVWCVNRHSLFYKFYSMTFALLS